MHEMSTCRSLIQSVENAVQDYVGIKILSIDVDIGLLANIDTNELQQLFPLASLNTITEDAKLNINITPVNIRCEACGMESETNDKDMNCPDCNSNQTIILSGTDMLLTNVEVESER